MARDLTDSTGKTIKVVKGQIIGCDLCHKIEKSFMNSPTGNAQEHAPPQPETFTIKVAPAAGGMTMGGMGH